MEDNLDYTSSIPSVNDYLGSGNYPKPQKQRYNPFILLAPGLLELFFSKGKTFFVLQPYDRGPAHPTRSILITPYAEREEAQKHFDAIPEISQREILDANSPGDRERLYTYAGQLEGTAAYVPILKEKVAKEPPLLKQRVRRYLQQQKKGAIRSVELIQMTVVYGQLMIEIHLPKEVLSVSLGEIENVDDANQWKTLLPGVSDGELPF
ncbi:hypothetical protein ACFOTA_06965 [Chitinophaga sp. GCM10012297]|uniref:Uncharacterized protein n=1 Tax=Chitinophaga chungangae TaxID=2821488 RepID=A0ABS3YB80_9BACT|nr:hypothetical protein [Chitinophaga chungangae]MBO9151940.1 hypothetical protein [Chitinophaga chungangae]